MKLSVLLVCLALLSLAAAFGPPGRRGHRGHPGGRGHHGHRGRHHGKGWGRCEQGKPDVEAWKCFKAKRACRVTENNVITKDIKCANGTACAGAVTTLGNLKFQMCGPVACSDWPRWSFKCGPVFDTETEEGRKEGQRNTTISLRWLRRSRRSPGEEDEDEDETDDQTEEEDAFRSPRAHSRAEVNLCRLDTVQKQRWYRFACLVKQNSNEVKKAECRHNGTCSVSTETTYTFNGVQYTTRFCTGCECPWKGKGQNFGRGRGNQNVGRGRGQQNAGRGRRNQHTGHSRGQQNGRRGRNQERVGRGRGQQNVGRGRGGRGRA